MGLSLGIGLSLTKGRAAGGGGGGVTPVAPGLAAVSCSFDGFPGGNASTNDTSGHRKGLQPSDLYNLTVSDGRFGNAYSIGGSAGVADPVPVFDPRTDSFSMGGWVRVASGINENGADCLVLKLTLGTAPLFAIRLSAPPFVTVTAEAQDGDFTATVTGLEFNTWIHVGLTVAGGVMTLWVGGVAVATADVSGMDAPQEGDALTFYVFDCFGQAGIDDVFVSPLEYSAGEFAYLQTNPHPVSVSGGAFTWSQNDFDIVTITLTSQIDGNPTLDLVVAVDYGDGLGPQSIDPYYWSGKEFTYHYSSAGVYTVVLLVDGIEVQTESVTVTSTLTAALDVTNTSGDGFYLGDTVLLTDQSTPPAGYDPDLNVYYASPFGGSPEVAGTGADPVGYILGIAGPITFALSIEGPGGTAGLNTDPVTVLNPPVITTVDYTTTGTTADLFSVIPSWAGGVPDYVFEYDWGGGFQTSESHYYGLAGEYALNVRVTDGNGRVSATSGPYPITVTDP